MPAYSIIYGPVSSWRLGRSLGIDLLSTEQKTCSFNCIYCQLGRTVCYLTERKEFISVNKLAEELGMITHIAADYITFSGRGEPTLASNLGEAINAAKTILHLPVAVLTNSSLMSRKDVRQELAQADVVVAKLDAPSEELFRLINRPAKSLHLGEVIEGIRLFRTEYKGKLALQVMFVEVNRDYASAMASITEELSPDEVQINTPLRSCGVKPLPAGEIAIIRQEFIGLANVVTAYEAARPEVTPLSLEETLRRRPEL